MTIFSEIEYFLLKLEDDVFEDKETSEIDLEFLNQVNELYKNYFEKDFNKRIVIEGKERNRVKLMLDSINPKEKTWAENIL